jgi:hypothetical protein
MTTEQRLEKLERQNRWMRRIGAVAVAVAAAVFLIGQGKEKKLPDLEVRSLIIKDKKGTARAQLTTRDNGEPFLMFWGKAGEVRTFLGMRGLFFSDKAANRVALGLRSDGAGETAFLTLFGRDGTQRVKLLTAPNGPAFLALGDKGGPRAHFLLAAGVPQLTFLDKNRKVRATFGTAATGRPFLALCDKDQRPRAALGADEHIDPKTGAKEITPENTLRLFDAKGKVIWKAPKD